MTDLPITQFTSLMISDPEDNKQGGFYVAQMTTAQRDRIDTLRNGMIVYNTDANAFNFYQNGAWVTLGADVIDPDILAEPNRLIKVSGEANRADRRLVASNAVADEVEA